MALADFKMILADFLTLFLDTEWKFFIGNSAQEFIIILLLFYAIRFTVSGYSSARPKVSRSLLMEWDLLFLCIKYVHIAFLKTRLGVLKVSFCIILYLAFSVLFGFFKVDLVFFGYDYLATLR